MNLLGNCSRWPALRQFYYNIEMLTRCCKGGASYHMRQMIATGERAGAAQSKSEKAKVRRPMLPYFCPWPFNFGLTLDVFRLAATLRAAAKYREHDEQHEADESNNDSHLDGEHQETDEGDELAQERNNEHNDGQDSAPATERFE